MFTVAEALSWCRRHKTHHHRTPPDKPTIVFNCFPGPFVQARVVLGPKERERLRRTRDVLSDSLSLICNVNIRLLSLENKQHGLLKCINLNLC